MSHDELEARLQQDGRELCRQLFQDHLDLRTVTEEPLSEVKDRDGVPRRSVEAGHERALTSIFGPLRFSRLAYRTKHRGRENLHPSDGALNLPAGRHTHGLRELAAIEATRGSYEQARAAIARQTGVLIGKRQLEGLAARAASDVASFYEQRPRELPSRADVLVISADGKGIVMRPEGLRERTRKAAEKEQHKIKTRLSRGERSNRKRIAEIAAVYDVTPVARSPADILSDEGEEGPRKVPVAKGKWLTGSVVDEAYEVIARAFDEGERRDPTHVRTWVALVDGNKSQIDQIHDEAIARCVKIAIVCDCVHVLEYLWGAAWCFFEEGTAEAEAWVREKLLAVLRGDAGIVAGSIGRKATNLGLDKSKRANADACASYLKNKERYLDYPTALENGWPIATGVIEGACRHLVRDRFDITGARWGLVGAEAVLTLRAVLANGDWRDYWRYHLGKERSRVHESRYERGLIPVAP
jgi:hypothetical protein